MTNLTWLCAALFVATMLAGGFFPLPIDKTVQPSLIYASYAPAR